MCARAHDFGGLTKFGATAPGAILDPQAPQLLAFNSDRGMMASK
ncbi:hypothetical protein L520_1656 [Bordetella bronchiseptica MBORD681]|nr:hypothetical protein L520_1656 [Bordetella bronchiseptica MBORD681]KDD03302.1 hypothetical protein L521_1859 [Bordetella bronchiseptica MBORD698]